MPAVEDVIAAAPVFTGLDGAQVMTIAECARPGQFEADEMLFREGDQADFFHVLLDGDVALELHAPARLPLIIETLHEHDVVGWSWLVPPYRWHMDARAVTPVRTIAFDARCLRGKAETDPVIGYELLQRFSKVMLERLQATRLRLLDLYGRGSA